MEPTASMTSQEVSGDSQLGGFSAPCHATARCYLRWHLRAPTRLYLFPPVPGRRWNSTGGRVSYTYGTPFRVHRPFLHTDDPGFCPCVPFPPGDLTILLERLLLECTLCTSTSSAVGLALRWRCQDSNTLHTCTPQTQTQTQYQQSDENAQIHKCHIPQIQCV